MPTTIVRHTHLVPGNHRDAFEAGIRQCADEHGGHVVGDPSLVVAGGGRRTEFTVTTLEPWWDEWLAVHVPAMWQAHLLDRGMDRWKAVAFAEELRERMQDAVRSGYYDDRSIPHQP